MAKLDIFDFSSGQNSKSSPLFLGNNECELIQNYHLDNLGSLTKRNGIAYLIGQLVDTKSILGMYYFADQQGTDYSNILVASDVSAGTSSTISKVASNAWANSKTLDTTGALPVFCSFIDYVFRTNGSDAMGSSTDLASWVTTNCLATLIMKYCCVWEDRLYALNDNSSTKYPSRIWWSELPTGTPLALTFGANNWADINPDDNDQITWGEPFGRALLIFKENAVYRWTFGQVEPDKIISFGTPQRRTVKQTQGICFFANKYGVFAFDGNTQPILISRKVQPFIDQIPTLTSMRAEVDNDHYYLYIGDVTVKGETYNNTMLVYTLSAKAWHIETYPFEIKSMARFGNKTLSTTTAIYDSIYLGDDDGFVYRKGTGTSDYLGTAAKLIAGRILTKEYPLADFPKTSNLKNLYFLAQKAIGSKVNYRIDRGDWTGWKDLKMRVTDGRLAGRARTIQFSITDYSDQTSQIEGLSVELEGEKEIRRKSND